MAGAGYKLFNTGDVLTAAQVNTYLMEQTVMVFADAAARTAALSGVVSEGMISYLKDTNAVEVYNGSAWVASDDPNAIQNTIVDAKGDLISASAADTPARLAVGNNGESLVADSSTSTGLRWQSNFAAGKNKIINGDFNIWQRGTSFSFTAAQAGYTADRYSCYVGNTGAGTISQQTFTAGTAPVSGYEGKFFLRFNQTTGAGNQPSMVHKIEGARTFAGQTVTLSFWAKASASLTLGGINLSQYFGTGGSPSAQVDTAFTSVSAITTSWVRYSYTVAVPSVSGKTFGTNNNDSLDLTFNFPSSSTFTFDIWGVQLEAGNTATAFQTATGTLAGELAAAMRYYQRFGGTNPNPGAAGYGYAQNTSSIVLSIPPLVQMRTTPTAVDSATLLVQDNLNNLINVTGAFIDNNVMSPSCFAVVLNSAAAYTAGRTYRLIGNASTAYIGFSAEL